VSARETQRASLRSLAVCSPPRRASACSCPPPRTPRLRAARFPRPLAALRPAVVALLLRRWLAPASQRASRRARISNAPARSSEKQKQKQKQKPDGERGGTPRFLFMVLRRVKGALRGFATRPWKTHRTRFPPARPVTSGAEKRHHENAAWYLSPSLLPVLSAGQPPSPRAHRAVRKAWRASPLVLLLAVVLAVVVRPGAGAPGRRPSDSLGLHLDAGRLIR
jgi:hypothetical protein